MAIRRKVDFYSVRAFWTPLHEILVVLIIIGILVLLALPNLMPLISKAKSTEAKLQLQHVYTLEKNYFYEKSRYSKDFAEILVLSSRSHRPRTGGRRTTGSRSLYRCEQYDVSCPGDGRCRLQWRWEFRYMGDRSESTFD